MSDQVKVNVLIDCDIHNDDYTLMEGDMTGNQIVNFLLSDCGRVWEEDDSPEAAHRIPGDPYIWYLGMGEKPGKMHLVIDETLYLWEWLPGNADFRNLREFIDTLLIHEVITSDQHQRLEEAIKVGETIGNIHEIGNYLKRKRDQKEVKAA